MCSVIGYKGKFQTALVKKLLFNSRIRGLHAFGYSFYKHKKLTKKVAEILHNQFLYYLKNYNGNVYQIETTLCAYKKYRKGQRYVGFYIERMRKEIETMQYRSLNGIAWETLWQFRNETFDKAYLNEYK